MEQVTVNVFEYKELSEEAKEKVLNEVRSWDLYAWEHENRATLDAFCDEWGITNLDWEYGGYRPSHISGSFNFDEEENLKGVRLRTWIINNHWGDLYRKKYVGWLKTQKRPHHSKCQIEEAMPTGYYLDSVIRRPIYKFLQKPNGQLMEDILKDCLEEWVEACNEESEYCFSREGIEELITINEYRFLENGQLF